MSAASVICPVFQPEEFLDLTSFIEDLDYGPLYQIGKTVLHTVWKLRDFILILFRGKIEFRTNYLFCTTKIVQFLIWTNLKDSNHN